MLKDDKWYWLLSKPTNMNNQIIIQCNPNFSVLWISYISAENRLQQTSIENCSYKAMQLTGNSYKPWYNHHSNK